MLYNGIDFDTYFKYYPNKEGYFGRYGGVYVDEELVLEAAKKCGKVITCEEHSVIGGLGEAVASLLAEKQPTLVRRIGVNDEFGHSGPAAALLKQFGLSAENIVKVTKEVCGK